MFHIWTENISSRLLWTRSSQQFYHIPWKGILLFTVHSAYLPWRSESLTATRMVPLVTCVHAISTLFAPAPWLHNNHPCPLSSLLPAGKITNIWLTYLHIWLSASSKACVVHYYDRKVLYIWWRATHTKFDEDKNLQYFFIKETVSWDCFFTHFKPVG